VPTAAVLSGAPGDYVYLVNKDNTASVHKVTLGPSDGKNTVIASGLAAGDTVVIDGTDRLSDGAKIKVAPAPAPTTAPTTAPAPATAAPPQVSQTPASPPSAKNKTDGSTAPSPPSKDR
jgi:multidrug efflux system membrane fusion protein